MGQQPVTYPLSFSGGFVHHSLSGWVGHRETMCSNPYRLCNVLFQCIIPMYRLNKSINANVTNIGAYKNRMDFDLLPVKKFLFFITVGLGASSGALAASQSQISERSTASVVLNQQANTEGTASIPQGTPVTLRLKQAVTSRKSKRGDYFDFELVNDIRSGTSIVVPAGTLGVGQVVHSAPKGFGGSAGELIIAARYLTTATGRLALRKTRFSVAGSDNAGAAIITSLAAPIVSIFVTGTSVDMNVGSIIVAETSEDFPNESAIKQDN